MRFSINTPVVATAARRLLSATSVVQGIVSELAVPTHDFCLRQAREILWQDGYGEEAGFFSKYAHILENGAAWVDEGWRNTAHYFDPVTNRGLMGWPNAAIQCERYYLKALREYNKGKNQRAFFLLGASLHLVQDVCVPHHTRIALFKGHSRFEYFARDNRQEYAVTSNGIYGPDGRISHWVIENAKLSYDHWHLVDGFSSTKDYHRACEILLTRAQKTTAGVLKMFSEQIGLKEVKVI